MWTSGEVAEALPDGLVLGPQHDEHAALDARGRPSAARASLVLGASKPQASTTSDLALGGPVGQGRAQGEADHLLGGPLRVAAGLRAEGHAAADASCGERIEPGRARPVPFCFHGLAPPPRTSARVLVVWVPGRRAASWAVTTWCITGDVGLDAEDGVVELDGAGLGARRRRCVSTVGHRHLHLPSRRHG